MIGTEKLAKIKSASLEIKERGILNFWILVDYEDGLSQGVGGIALDEFSPEKDCRVGTAYGCEIIRRILLALNVNDFQEMKGRHIFVIGHGGPGLGFRPIGIRKLSTDVGDKRPVIFEDIFKEFQLEAA